MSSILTGLTGLYDILTESVKVLVALSTPTTPTHTQPPQIEIEMDASVCADDRPMTYYNFYTGDISSSFEWVLI